MELFKYLQEEDQMIEEKLQSLISNFANQTREQIFDEVKAICDQIRANTDKKTTLVSANLGNSSQEARIKEQADNDRLGLLDEVESIVMVHVDEPGFRDLLKHLLNRYKSHLNLWNRIEDQLETALTPAQRQKLETGFKKFSHSLTGFNVLPTEAGKSADARERENKVKARVD